MTGCFFGSRVRGRASTLRAALSLVLGFVTLGCASGRAGQGTHGQRSTRGEAEALPDAIVVLGHRPPLAGNELEYETRARVDRGVALFLAGRAPRLLFSGGPSTPEAVEADVMAAYAAAQGVPESALRRERASRDTIENARLSVALLRRELALEAHGSARTPVAARDSSAREREQERPRRPRIVLVTSDYHVERASMLFRCAGADVDSESVPLSLTKRERRKKNRSERWVRFYYLFFDECARAAGSHGARSRYGSRFRSERPKCAYG